MSLPKMYTPAEVAQILQLSEKTVYKLINSGEIVAKKIGRVYRIPKRSISYAITGFDEDVLEAIREDLKNLDKVEEVMKEVRYGENK